MRSLWYIANICFLFLQRGVSLLAQFFLLFAFLLSCLDVLSHVPDDDSNCIRLQPHLDVVEILEAVVHSEDTNLVPVTLSD